MFVEQSFHQSRHVTDVTGDVLPALFETPEGGGEGDAGKESSLEDVARDEREYVRERLREERGREPTEEEVSEWLRRHTEGY